MIVPVVAGIIHSSTDFNTVLITKKGKCECGCALEHFYELPGGKVEKGECLQDTARREIFEELSIRVAVGRLVWAQVNEYSHTEDSFLVVYYDCFPCGCYLAPEHMPENFIPHAWVNKDTVRSYHILTGTFSAISKSVC